ncbi:uncharacterized protein A4U43_C05F6350 [Asparagus officinalis]|uniref:Uncharacterized protein n=1 Tax=Asparagus officinalis TaxID=4686 RepID=A0A5P1EV75_ASPOF|nr:uncharacterized protein A4U43_C05F6350 [Asparagus officinalis]
MTVKDGERGGWRWEDTCELKDGGGRGQRWDKRERSKGKEGNDDVDNVGFLSHARMIQVIVGLWIVSYIGSSFSIFTLIYIGDELLQVRELLAKNREEYDELIELEKKLISGGNCGNESEDETEGEEQEQDDGEDEEDGDDPTDGEDGGDTSDGEDDDDSDTNVGGNVVEDDEINTREQGEQSHEEMGKDEERSEKKSGGNKENKVMKRWVKMKKGVRKKVVALNTRGRKNNQR